MHAEIETTKVPLNGIELNVARGGHGPPLVLVHGWPHTWQVWRSMMPMLAHHFAVIAPDLRGLGASSSAEVGFDAEAGAEDIASLLDALGVSSAAVMAIDAGVPVATMLALTRPERVGRLIVMEGLLPGVAGGFDAMP